MADYHLTRYLAEDTRVDLWCSNQTILFSRFWHSLHLFISPSTFFAFFYCNIYYKTRQVATCSHRLPFIVPCSQSSPSPPVPSFYPITRVLLHPCSLLFLCYPCLPCSPLLPLFPLFPFSPFSPLFSCFLFLPVPLVLLCSPCSKHFIMIFIF